jgi:hypothetical protein
MAARTGHFQTVGQQAGDISGIRPTKHPEKLDADGAAVAQAASWAMRGVLVAPALSLAEAAGVESATFRLVAAGRRSKSQTR